jgi:hypothetical protein
VKEIGKSALTIHIPRLDQSGKTTATLQFAKLAGAAKGAGLTERATFEWFDNDVGGHGFTNTPQPVAQALYPLAVSEVSLEGMPTKRFSSSLFAPAEPITFWCNMPDGEVHALMLKGGTVAAFEHKVSSKDKTAKVYGEYLGADENGSFVVDLGEGDLTPGYYSIVAYGNWTGLTAVGAFQVK